MKVRVYAPMGADTSVLDDQSCMNIKEGTKVNEVLRLLKVNPVSRVLLPVSVNNQMVSKNHVLSDGDTLSVFKMISGG